MLSVKHPLHETIGNIFRKTKWLKSNEYKTVFEEATGEKQRIPLFTSENKSRITWMCNPDLLVIKNGKVKIIVEIEESNLGPTQVCGKFLTSALCTHYFHHSEEDGIEMENPLFIQIMGTKKLSENTSKYYQWTNIQEKIQGLLPNNNIPIQKYALLYGTSEEFNDPDNENRKELEKLIQDICIK